MRHISAVLLCLVLVGCITSSGERSAGFLNPTIEASYIPLSAPEYLVLEARGAAVVVAPGIAVTNAHNANIIGAAQILGISKNYDLLFFRTNHASTIPLGEATTGEKIVAYGQGVSGEVREAKGAISELEVPVQPRCGGCVVQKAFVYDADAGPGFSGGPVVDSHTGAVVGITFGYLDPHGHRIMYAYAMSRVATEYEVITGTRLPGFNS